MWDRTAQQCPSPYHAEDDHAMRAIFMVGYVGLPCPIVLPVPRLSRKIGLLGLALEGYRLGRCRTMSPYGSRRGGSKYAPSRTLCLAACITPHIQYIFDHSCFVDREEKGSARLWPAPGVVSSSAGSSFPFPLQVPCLTDSFILIFSLHGPTAEAV